MIKKIIITTTLLTTTLFSAFNANISSIPPDIKNRMVRGNSWREGCPVPLYNLRYLQLVYHDFNGKDRLGEMIVHKDIADDVIYIMEKLYNIGYPIRQMRLVSDFHANDWKSIDVDNTSAFNCRNVTGSKKKWSNHAYGKAIDINPIENPYISKKGHISHKASQKYRRRVHHGYRTSADKALILQNDKITKIFKQYGFRWGGDWKYTKDYQHFDKR
ncbi:MAG TPA: M15 family peptidase [Campylobacterales bacterium]|nr:M15 family peptidase [Campylobacterales bacterium]HHD80494.1 M15 family peptidase [Campylobacterales bacterium]